MLDGARLGRARPRTPADLFLPKNDAKVNLIPTTRRETGYQGSPTEASIPRHPDETGIHATVRLTRGRDIDAASGQLLVTGRRLTGSGSSRAPGSPFLPSVNAGGRDGFLVEGGSDPARLTRRGSEAKRSRLSSGLRGRTPGVPSRRLHVLAFGLLCRPRRSGRFHPELARELVERL